MSAADYFLLDAEVMNDCLADLPVGSDDSFRMQSEKLSFMLHQMLVTGSCYFGVGMEENEAWAY